MTDTIDLNEFVGGFIVEADELIAAANAQLLEIEAAITTGRPHPRAVRELFRALHTIKGLAGMIGVEPIVEISHELETIVRNADRAGGQLGKHAIDVAIQGVQAIAERVRAVAEHRVPAPAPERLLAAIAAADTPAGEVSAAAPVAHAWDARLSAGERQQVAAALGRRAHVWAIAFTPDHAKAAAGVNIATVRARLAELGELIKVVPRTTADGIAFDLLVVSEAATDALAAAAATTSDHVVAVAAQAAPAGPPVDVGGRLDDLGDAAFDTEATPVGRATVRVEMSRLDDLQEQLSLLIVSRFRLDREIAAHAERGHDVRGLREVAELQARQLRDLRRAILRARTVRVAEVLEPLSLVVRSAARANHKDVRLELDVKDTEIDKAVADRLLPAFVHLVRNAVDHAIEPAEDRRARAKPPAGIVRISCVEVAGNQLEVTVEDDGRGIDRAAVARRAKREITDDHALIDVLATPGFSTRDVATQTSGRGLGMDIVKRIVVGELGGELDVDSVVGAGTTFRMRVPLTIAIVDVFTFRCSGQLFVVPVSSVEEIFELSAADQVRPPSPGRPSRVALVERRGHAIPVVALGALLALDDGGGARNAMVIHRGGEPIAFAVDRMLGRQEVVVRPIPDPLVRVPGIAGATDLGDGQPTLVLDLLELGLGVRGAA